MEGTDIRTEIDKRLSELKGKVSPKDYKLREEALVKIYIEGQKPYEAFGMKKDELEYIYSHAYNLYNAGKYKDAIQIFHILMYLDDSDHRFLYGLAACYHMKKEYPKALVLYLGCQLVDPENPVLLWHIADCYKQIGKKYAALLYLKLALKYSDLIVIYSVLKTKIEKEIEALEIEIDSETELDDAEQLSSNKERK